MITFKNDLTWWWIYFYILFLIFIICLYNSGVILQVRDFFPLFLAFCFLFWKINLFDNHNLQFEIFLKL